MTRKEEELYDAAEKFSDDYKYSGDVDYMSIRIAFIEGAEWSNRNHDLSSLWHDASEEPKEEGYNEILCINDKLFSFTFSPTSFSNWELCREKFNIKQWAYIADLLPKN